MTRQQLLMTTLSTPDEKSDHERSDVEEEDNNTERDKLKCVHLIYI